MQKTAIVFGATGLVGRYCLEAVCGDPNYGRVVAIGRRWSPLQEPKLTNLTHSLEDIRDLRSEDTGIVHDVFCCLGTTQAKAGSADAFRAVDRDAVIAVCALAARVGARHFLMVSAVGAWSRAPILYNRTKGEAEDGCRGYAGHLRVSIFRPSLLLGERDEFRYKEKLGEPFLRLLAPAMLGPASRYRPIRAATVAAAMVAAARTDPEATGSIVYEHDAIVKLAHSR